MRVLLVDNDAMERERLRRIFLRSPFSIVEACDGEQALQILDSQVIDAIVSDILMPRMDGYRLCIEVRNRNNLQHIPFFIHTNTYTSEADEKKALSLGANKFLRKSANEAELLTALMELPGQAPALQAG